MKKLTAAIAAAIFSVLICTLALGAGFFEQGTAPAGGYPSAPTFTHWGAQSGTATDNIVSPRGYFSTILRLGNYGVLTSNDNAWTKQDTVFSMTRNVFKDNNVRIGAAGNDTMTGLHNFFAGDSAGLSNTTGTEGAAIGKNALRLNTTGNYNYAFGDNTAAAGVTANFVNAFGWNTLSQNTASENCGFGAVVLRRNTSGENNSGFGNDSLAYNDNGSNNSGFGQFSLAGNISGSNNTAVGHSAGFFTTSGSGNSFFGKDSWSNTTGSNNSFFGISSGGANTTGSNNSGFGAFAGTEAGATNLSGATALGSSATVNCSNCITLGPDPASANGGTAVKVGIGFMTPRYPLDVVGNANITGSVGIGGDTTTSALGPGAKLNVAGTVSIQDNSAVFWGTNQNTKIAYDGAGGGWFTYQAAFGGHLFNTYDSGYVTKLTIAADGTLTAASLTGTSSRAVVADASGVLSAPTSDARAKENIHPLTDNLDVIALLKNPDVHAVYYSWKDKSKGSGPEIGFTAQMFEHSVPEITGTDNKGNLYLDYQKLAAILWEQNRILLNRIEALEKSFYSIPATLIISEFDNK